MKKPFAILFIIGISALAACGATAKLTAPKAGEPWALNTAQTISWTWSGSAKVKLVLDSKSLGKLGNIKTDLDLSAGSCAWTVGALEKGKGAPAGGDYSIRIVDMADGKELDTSPVFAITGGGGQQPPTTFKVVPIEGFIIPAAGKAIQVSKPGKDAVWIPLKTYTVKWEWSVPLSASFNCGPGSGCMGCLVDLWLVPTAGTADQKVLLAKSRCTAQNASQGMAQYAGEYEGIVPNAASGSYLVRVQLSGNSNYYGDSPVFAVQSTLSPDTGFVLPDATQDQVDLALRDIIIDSDGVVRIKIKNMGERFDGRIRFVGQKTVKGRNPTNFENEESFIFQTNEEKSLAWWDLGGFQFENNPGSNGKYIPANTRPFSVSLKITASGDINPSNDTIYKELCRLNDADIGTDGEIRLIFSPGTDLYINRGTSNTIHESKVKWVDKSTFAATLEVRLWNFGCRSKTFDIWLYADKLPGQCIFPGATLHAGDKTDFSWPVKVKLDSKCGSHSLVFIADPPEAKNQPYPDSYLNNVIHGTLKIECGGTIEASSALGSKKK